jgi:hypothetical protein
MTLRCTCDGVKSRKLLDMKDQGDFLDVGREMAYLHGRFHACEEQPFPALLEVGYSGQFCQDFEFLKYFH